jgi:uncharacterized membrane protein YcgQ (UPF0703/DUF1980 family)
MKVIDFKTSAYFSSPLIIAAIAFMFTSMFMFPLHYVIGLILLTISMVIFTTHYRLRIDLNNKSYHDYLWILGLKHGEKGKFESVEHLFIKKSKVSQTMSLRAASTTITKNVFDGYLKFSEGNKIHIATMDNKEELVNKLRAISTKLNTRIIDYSDGLPKEL